jgi:hypothetical protein
MAQGMHAAGRRRFPRRAYWNHSDKFSWEERLVDVNRLGERIVSPPNVRMFIDGDQGHGWNEGAVHRQLEVLRDFYEAQPHHGSVGPLDSTRAPGPLQ